MTQRLNVLIRSSTELETYVVSVERIKEYQDLEPEAPWVIDDKRPPKGRTNNEIDY